MRGRWLALGLAILLLPTARADWLQPGYDAAQTGNTPEAGPAWDDVVFETRLPADETPVNPVIVGDWAWVAYANGTAGNVLVRVSLLNATVQTMGAPNPAGYVHALASDGTRIFALTDPGRLEAFDAATGARLWTSRVEPLPLTGSDIGVSPHVNGASNCLFGILLVSDAQVIAACDAHESAMHVAGYAVDSGALAWNYTWDGRAPRPNQPGNGLVTDEYQDAALRTAPPGGIAVFPTGLTQVGGRVVVAFLVFELPDQSSATRGSVAYGQYVGIEAGQAVWAASNGAGGDASQRADGNTGSANAPPAATGVPGKLFTELTSVGQWSPENTGPYPDRTAIIRAQGSTLEGDPASGFGLTPDALYATSRHTLFLLDESLTTEATQQAPGGMEWGPGAVVHSGNGFLYALTGADGAGFGGYHANLVSLDSRTLAVRWIHRMPTDSRFGVSAGMAVLWTLDGRLVVLGHNAASPQPVAKVSNTIPAPGDLVTVDLSGSGPGLFGNITQYRADWGDGQATDWQDSPILVHRFSTLTNVESRFFVRNAANQTASMTQLFVVGGRPELTFLQQQFAPERQNVTFFVLGLLATALAALWGVVQIRRSHGRLRRELNALEERLAGLQGRPESLDEALRGFRSHAQDLLQRRKLDQSQYLVLRERIEELQREVRMSVVDERLAFLPHGMVKRLEAMLADAQVTGWERHHFLEALEQERLLTPLQRNQVRGLVDSWFRADQPT